MNDTAPANARVLVVDDQPPNIRLLEAILTPRGYDVRAASSGEEALAAIDEDDVDLVLLDIVMPGMDGYEVCRRIRERPATAYLPVVMVTASGDEQKIKALEAGADDFLTKPINTERAARAGGVAGADQALPGHHQAPVRRARRVEPASSRSGWRSRCRRSSGWAGCGASSRRSWPS